MIIHALCVTALLMFLSKKELTRWQYVQNSSARLLISTNRTNIIPILKSLYWLLVFYHVHCKISILMF